MIAEKNRIPEKVDTIHLTAVCGTGMGALACMLKDMGYRVTGSDQNVYPPMSDFLRDRGVGIVEGYREGNLSHNPDLVVVGNAISRDNPEAKAIRQQQLNYCSMPQALNRFAVGERESILITGTHGKTTTASLMAWVLHAAGLDPSFMIGGIVNDFNSNYRIGQGSFTVIEGDEYDTAFFDKGPKFMHYHPHIAVLTSVEFDHADIFSDFKQVTDAFAAFINGLTAGSRLIACTDDRAVASLIEGYGGNLVTYGRSSRSDWRLGDIEIDPPWNRFEVFEKDRLFGRFKTTLPGTHNLLNAVAVIAAAAALDIPVAVISSALEAFTGIKRRQEVRGVKRGVTVMDDFAHHPTAVRETIRALKPFYAGGRLIAVFEPRTNSSMRDIFQNVYPDSFDQADIVCVRQPPMLKKIPPNQRFSSEKLVADLIAKGKTAHYFSNTDAIIEFVAGDARAGDLVLVMSNGGFDNIHNRLLETL